MPEQSEQSLTTLFKKAQIMGEIKNPPYAFVMFEHDAEEERDAAARAVEQRYEIEIPAENRYTLHNHPGFWLPSKVKDMHGQDVETKEVHHLRGLVNIGHVVDAGKEKTHDLLHERLFTTAQKIDGIIDRVKLQVYAKPEFRLAPTKHKTEEENRRARFDKAFLVVKAGDQAEVLFDAQMSEAAYFAAQQCARDGDNPQLYSYDEEGSLAQTDKGPVPQIVPQLYVHHGNHTAYSSFSVRTDSKAFQTLTQLAADHRLTLLKAADTQDQHHNIQGMLLRKNELAKNYTQHAVGYATAPNLNYAYVVFDSSDHEYDAGNEAQLAADAARDDGLMAPFFDEGNFVEPIEVDNKVTHLPHTYYGFYISTRSPEFRLLQQLETETGVQHVQSTIPRMIDEPRLHELLAKRTTEQEETPVSFELREACRHAVVSATVKNSEHGYVVFDRLREADAKRFTALVKEELEEEGHYADAEMDHITLPSRGADDVAAQKYPYVLLPVDSEAFRVARAKTNERAPLQTITDAASHVDCETKIQQQLSLRRECRLTQNHAQRN